ncbi:Protein HIGH CHLOROPHYLL FLUORESCENCE PHENOTYPE 173, chloroplastic, partial [Linum perenne]
RADEVQKLNYSTISPEALVGEPSVLFHPISRRLMESCCSSLKASPLSSHQGFGSAIGRTSSRIPSLYKPFVQLDHRRNSVRFGSGTVRRGIVLAEAKNQGWDLGRFVKTFYFFNSPPSPAKFIQSLIERVSSPSPSESDKRMETSEVVLVVGATGGVGKRVVDILQKKGIPVRALVRNEEKAKRLLGPDVDLIVGDITKVSTLDPELFKGVRKVINAASVIVGPKEGDTPERAKYSQGIKFFEPEIKGDSPEMVEYNGMKNLISAVKGTVGLRSGKLLFGCEGSEFKDLPWGSLDDVVMGGVSESTFQIDTTGGEDGGPTGVFKGVVSTANNGGFTSVRTKNFSVPEDVSAYDGFELRLKGDGRRYKLIVRTSSDWDTVGYTVGFDTTEGQWQSIRLPFSSLKPIFRARTVPDAPPFDPSNIISFQLMFSKFESDGKLNPTFAEGPFQLPLSSIKTFLKEPITPRFVHVGSAGVTRPDRPGLDLTKQPPAVRLNKELDFILTFKLKGEDVIRESGVPYAIVRPCALTEEPAGADLIFEQGDNITGKISREEVARICIAALESPYACDKTFEVKSVIPFSEPFTVDPENPPPEKDYEVYFKSLKDGITGKELLDRSPVPV